MPLAIGRRLVLHAYGPWSTKTQIDRRFRATGRDQTQTRSCRSWLDASTLVSSCVERQLVATGRKSRTCATRSKTCATRSNSTQPRRRLVAVRRRNAHIASDPATDQLPFDARALMSPATLRPTSCRLTPKRSYRQRICDRSVAASRR